MSDEKWISVLLLLLIVVISSFLKWTKQIKVAKLSASQIIAAMIKILIGSLAIVILISLPMINQPQIESKLLLPLGVLFIIFGVSLNIYSAKELKHIKFQMKGLGIPNRLITAGIFNIIRHPSSLGIIGITIGWCFAWRALYCIYFLIPVIVIGVILENKYEERNLEKIFGEEYRFYRKRVGMYFPKIIKDK